MINKTLKNICVPKLDILAAVTLSKVIEYPHIWTLMYHRFEEIKKRDPKTSLRD